MKIFLLLLVTTSFGFCQVSGSDLSSIDKSEYTFVKIEEEDLAKIKEANEIISKGNDLIELGNAKIHALKVKYGENNSLYRLTTCDEYEYTIVEFLGDMAFVQKLFLPSFCASLNSDIHGDLSVTSPHGPPNDGNSLWIYSNGNGSPIITNSPGDLNVVIKD